MPRSRQGEPTWPELAAGLVGMLWRGRLELGVMGVIVVGFVLLAGLVGDAAAGVLLAGLVALVLALPVLRGGLLHALRAARLRRAWWRAWTDCELPRVRAGKVSAIPAGELIRVRASRGSSLEHVEQRAEQLAVCLRVREVRIARDADDAATGTVTLVRRDPLAGLASVPWPQREAESLSLWEPIPLGLDELGATVSVSLPERNVLLGGEPGAGKSAALSILVASGRARPGRAAVAAGRQAGGTGRVDALRAAGRRPGHRSGDRAAARAPGGDGGPIPRAAGPRPAQDHA